jgi:hypothetical protein
LLAYYDADDITSLWQNTGMSTPVALDGNPIARWNDRCGNAAFYDLTCIGGLDANRAAYRTTGVAGKPCVDFLGTNGATGFSGLVNTAFRKDLAAITVLFTGIIYETDPDLWALTVGKAGVFDFNGVNSFLVRDTGASTNLQLYGSEDQASAMSASKTIDNTNPHLFAFAVDASVPGASVRTGYQWLDGGTPVTDTGTGPAATMAFDHISVGDYVAGAVPCRMKVRQLAIFGKKLSNDEFNTAGQILALKTPGITLTRF